MQPASCRPDCWEQPDERRFIDIYDLLNTDKLFSELHCYKTRLAAFDFYLRHLPVPCQTVVAHEHSMEAAKKLYLNHARGFSSLSQLNKLCEQCQRHWQTLSHTKFHGDGANSAGPFRGANQPRSSSTSPNEQVATNSKAKPNLTILRRGNGIKMMTCCDCGHRTNYMITPVDRKKKLERVDIHRLND